MIKIINVSETFSETGIQTYIVQVGDETIGEFDHVRSDGVAVCLQRAAETVQRAERRKNNLIVEGAKS